MRVDPTGPPADDFEVEPNDVAVDASPWTAGVAMRGHASTIDTDTFRVNVSGAPQLYQLDAKGEEIDGIDWIDRDGTELESGQVADGHGSASLEDMCPRTGDHWVAIHAIGDYTLALTPLGPPDPNGELEPNNDSMHAQALALDTPRTGRIVRFGDLDINRFSLQAAERLHLNLAPPADGSLAWKIYSGGTQVAFGPSATPGAPMEADLALPCR